MGYVHWRAGMEEVVCEWLVLTRHIHERWSKVVQ